MNSISSISFFNTDKEYDNLSVTNKMLVQSQINKVSLLLTKFRNAVDSLMNNLANFHNEYATTLYSTLDNLSNSLRDSKEINSNRINMSTKFVPFIYKYPCQDGIIARVFEISNHINNLFEIMKELGPNAPMLLDYLTNVFNKFEVALEELQSLIQRTSLMKCKESTILKSILYSEEEEISQEDSEDTD